MLRFNPYALPPRGPRASSHRVPWVSVPSPWAPKRPLEEAADPETAALAALVSAPKSSAEDARHRRTRPDSLSRELKTGSLGFQPACQVNDNQRLLHPGWTSLCGPKRRWTACREQED